MIVCPGYPDVYPSGLARTNSVKAWYCGQLLDEPINDSSTNLSHCHEIHHPCLVHKEYRHCRFTEFPHELPTHTARTCWIALWGICRDGYGFDIAISHTSCHGSA